MEERLTFCEECRKDAYYDVYDVIIKENFKGVEYEYEGKKAVCKECGSEVYVTEIRDYNLDALYEAYRIGNDLISLKEILEIPQKYDIGKRPLSLLLGWGEMTFTRYCDGYLPSKQYSDLLKQIYANHAFYQKILELNKDKLTDIAYEKSKRAVESLLGLNSTKSKINVVIDYLLCVCEDVTPLALQKALYYIQGFYYAFIGEFIFADDCEAWVHGPVYRDIYNRYKQYQFDPIDIHVKCDEGGLNVSEKAVIDSVIKNFCCFSGKILEQFTHSEMPWIKTRGDLKINEPSDRVIEKNLIASYFENIKELHRMATPSDIQNYSKSMFEKLN